MGPILVTDELPPVGREVLVYDPHFGWRVGYYRPNDVPTDDWYIYGTPHWADTYVTHWLPLPPIPHE